MEQWRWATARRRPARRHHRVALHRCKFKQRRATLCRHRGTPPLQQKSFSQKNFRRFGTPMHLLSVRYAGFCDGPSCVNPLRAQSLSPVSCFCPGSARGRHLMGSDEDRSANLATRSHLASCSRICGLTGSIVPATGPAPGEGVRPPEPLNFLLCLCLGGRLAGDELGPIDQHPMQDHGKLPGQRHLRLAQTSALGYPHRPALQRRTFDRPGQDDVGCLV